MGSVSALEEERPARTRGVKLKVRKKSKEEKDRKREKRKGTNESWNVETIWILSPLIPFFIPPEGATAVASFRFNL
jgi:hypothetical protein